MRRLLIVVVVGTVLAVAGLVTAALIRKTEQVASLRPHAPTNLLRFAVERLGDLVASARRKPSAPREPGPTPSPAASEPRFTYRVVGGLSGEGGDDVTITSTGKVTLVSPREPLPDSWSISDSRVAKLTALFNRHDFLRMRTTPELNPPCPDGFSSLVTYRYRGLMNEVKGGMMGERKHPFWQCYRALANVVSERRRIVGEKTPAHSPARIDSITVDGMPVTAKSTVVVDSHPHRISWRGVAEEGRSVTGFAIAIRRSYGHDDFADYSSHCPTGDYDYKFPVPGGPYYVTPVVYFSDSTYSWMEFEVIPEQSVGGMDRLMLNPRGGVTVLPQDRWKESERNRVAVAFDGKPVVRHDTVRVKGGRSHRISWRGVGATGCKPLRLMIGIQAERNGKVLDRADNCPDGYHDFTFPVSSKVFWVIPEVFFTDYTWAWGDFFVTSGGRPGPQNPGDSVIPKPQRRSHQMTLSKSNRVGHITLDGKPVAPGDTVRVEGGRSHRISWRGICADGCKATRLSLAVRAGYNGGFIDLANSCPGGNYDYTFPVTKRPFWLTPRVDFNDYTYAWEDSTSSPASVPSRSAPRE